MISKESKSLFENFKFNLNEDVINEAEEIKEDTSEELNSKIGGDYDDFISEISGLRKAINAMHEEASTHLAQQIIEETLLSLDNLLTKYEQEKDIEIVGALDEACKAEECDTKLTEGENGDSTFNLKINCNNDAFGEEGDEDTLINEVKRILNKVSDELVYTDSKSILDANGNNVGSYGFGFEGVTECDTKLTEGENGIPYGTYEEFENGVKEQGGLYGFIAEKSYSMPNALMREIAMNAVYELNNDEKIMADVKERLYDENSEVEGE